MRYTLCTFQKRTISSPLSGTGRAICTKFRRRKRSGFIYATDTLTCGIRLWHGKREPGRSARRVPGQQVSVAARVDRAAGQASRVLDCGSATAAAVVVVVVAVVDRRPAGRPLAIGTSPSARRTPPARQLQRRFSDVGGQRLSGKYSAARSCWPTADSKAGQREQAVRGHVEPTAVQNGLCRFQSCLGNRPQNASRHVAHVLGQQRFLGKNKKTRFFSFLSSLYAKQDYNFKPTPPHRDLTRRFAPVVTSLRNCHFPSLPLSPTELTERGRFLC